MKKLIATIITLLLLAPMGFAQFKAQLDSTNIMLGEQTTLTVSGTDQFPTMDYLAQNDIVPIMQRFDTINGKVQQHTLLTCFEEGEHYIKLSPNDSLRLTVNDVTGVDTTSLDIRDIESYMKEPITFHEVYRVYTFVISVLGIIAFIILLICYFVRRSRLKEMQEEEKPKAPPLPADIKAISSLEKLRVQQLWQQGKVKEYHTTLTDILRTYLAESYGIQSTEMTSDQTLEAFETTSACNADTEALLRQILQTADMVKFAKSEPQPYEHDRSMADAKQFVESTKPIETPKE